jgi:hypothetical protein
LYVAPLPEPARPPLDPDELSFELFEHAVITSAPASANGRTQVLGRVDRINYVLLLFTTACVRAAEYVRIGPQRTVGSAIAGVYARTAIQRAVTKT